MVEITARRCFVLWTQDRNGNVRFEPIVFTTAHAAINAGEEQVSKGHCADYNYSTVMQPVIGGEPDPVRKPLTVEPAAPTIHL